MMTDRPNTELYLRAGQLPSSKLPSSSSVGSVVRKSVRGVCLLFGLAVVLQVLQTVFVIWEKHRKWLSHQMHDYKMRIGHSLLWSHVFSRYYTTRGLFERLCTYMYFVETYSSSLIRNTPQWGWFCTVRRLPSKSAWSAQRVARAIVCYKAALQSYVLGFKQLSVFTQQR